MITIKGMKFRFYPTIEQTQALAVQFGHARYIYNAMLAARKKHFADTGKGLSQFACNNLITKLKTKPELDWLKQADSQVLQQQSRNLNSAYTNFFRGTAKYPHFKNKFAKQSIRYPQRYKVDGSKVYLPKVGWVKAIFHRPILGITKSVTVSKTKTNRYYMSFVCHIDLPVVPNVGPAVGIDLGLKDFCILSTGEKIAHPKYLRSKEHKLVRAQRRLSKKKKGSANRHKARIKVARVHEQISDARADFLHKLSHRIASTYSLIALEDLNIKGMVKNHCLAKSISDSGWAEFVRQLKYKAAERNSLVLQIDRFFPSSKTCNCCGFVNRDLQLSDRDWTCPECNTLLDRDINAANNILKQATVGTTECKACGDVVRPKALLGQRQTSMKQEAQKL